MPETTKSKGDTTLTLLMNIIEKSKHSVEEVLEIYLEYEEKYHDYKEFWRLDKDWSEYHAIDEKMRIHEWLFQGWAALDDLQKILPEVSYPKERARFFGVAVTLMPDVKLTHMAKGATSWGQIFEDFKLPRDYYIIFPKVEEEVDVCVIEEKLLEIAGGREFVPATEAKPVLPWATTSKTYKVVKKGLEDRGWCWKRKKVRGKQIRVIVCP